MPSPRFPATATLLDAKVCPLEKFDALFAKITQERKVGDGYFLQAHSEETWILFVVNGSPYAAGRLEADAFSFGEIHEFFAAYSRHPQSPLSFFVADKRLLLGLMVLFRHRPARQFATDLVDTGEILRELAARGADAILGLRAGEEWAIAICNKGQPVMNYFPPSGAEALQEVAPSAQLLAYVFTRPFGGVTVDVYEETRVDPAGDAILATPRTRSRLSIVFLRVAAKVQEAETVSQREREGAPAEVIPPEPAPPEVAPPAVVPEPATPPQAEEPVVATGEEMAAPEAAPTEVAAPSGPPAPAAIQGPIPEVLLFLGEKHLGTFSLGKSELTIGRNPGNDILIDNVGVSRRHAVIRVSGDRVVAEDLGSANGTFINGQRITSCALRDGDEILVLKHRLVYRVPKEGVTPKVKDPRDTGQQTMYIEAGAIAQAAAGKPDTSGPKLRPCLILPDLTKFALEAEEVTLGSGADCQIRLSGLFVARAHARIVPEREGQFKIMHLGGLAGTRVNGEKISEHVLKHGDEIVIGKQKLLFRLER
ncbi:MAG: FHA domain-containing protein [candidate division NC10 bacterium]|nr:FHA domain-containing protein [candidate division NC10 bacterium]